MHEVTAQFGAEAILPLSYGGSNGLLTQDTTDATLFRRLGASRLLRTVCAAPTGAANQGLYGKMPSVSYQDYPEARLIVVVGRQSGDLRHSPDAVPEGGARPRRRSWWSSIRARRRWRGRPTCSCSCGRAPISPSRWRFTATCSRAATPTRPSSPAHTTGAERLREKAAPWTFERAAEVSGVPVDSSDTFAELYAASSPALVKCGWGLERNRNGGSAAAAILALPAVGGKFGVRGGGYSMSNSASWNIERTGSAIRSRPRAPST